MTFGAPTRIGFVVHVMHVAGAEVLVAETIRRLAAQIEPTIFCLDDLGELGAHLRAEGVPVILLGRRPGLDARVPHRLAREIRHRGIELVHAHQYTPFFYSALARLVSPRSFRVIFTEHGRHYPDVVSRRRRLVNRLMLSRLADDVNAVSRFSADSLADLDGFSATRIGIIENGIDIARYLPYPDRQIARAAAGLDPGRRFVVCVARLHPVKDHVTLVRGFAAIAQAQPDVDLLLAGDGALRPDLHALVSSLDLAGRVTFLGVRHDVPALLQAADIFALTSLSEAASLTLLEAMASELPVVVTNVGGNPEIVDHGRHGILVPRGDSAAASGALLELLQNPVRAADMGRAARQRVLERYQFERTVSRYHERYTAVAQRMPRLSPRHAR